MTLPRCTPRSHRCTPNPQRGPSKPESVVERIKSLIHSGALRTGQRIPSVRAMAHQMGLSAMTVLDAYGRLEDDGVIESRPRSGYYVRPRPASSAHQTSAAPAGTRAQPLATGPHRARVPPWAEVLANLTRQQDLLPLGTGVPSPQLLAMGPLARHTVRALNGAPTARVANSSLGLGSSGLGALREQLAIRMVDSGCQLDTDSILVTVGATQALVASLRAVTAPGDAVAVESPGYTGFYGALEFLSLQALEIPSSSSHGLSVPALREALRGPAKLRAVLLCPTLSNPTGATMPDSAKAELVAACASAGVPIIEDDTFGELSFSSRRARSAKSFDPDNVVYVGSLSKLLAPEYRVGWIAGGRWQRDIAMAHGAMVMAPPLPTQLGAASFLAGGGIRRHLRRIRRIHAENMAMFRCLVAEAFPSGTRTASPEGGHFLWVELPELGDSLALANEAVAYGFFIAPGALFSAAGSHGRCLRLNTAVTDGERLRRALTTLGMLAARQLTAHAWSDP